MDIITIILIGLSLSMDCLAVSVATGIASTKVHWKNIFILSFSFGLFQGVMPLIGWFAGINFRQSIEFCDHWIAFGLLFLVGAKMIYEGIYDKEPKHTANIYKLTTIILLSIATSIDALAIGISFAFLNCSIATPIFIIGGITFIVSILGNYFGVKLGNASRFKIEIIGGFILIAIGIKIAIEHLLDHGFLNN